MNIKERNQQIAQHTDIVSFGGKKIQSKKAMDIAMYWNTLQRPPIRSYIADWVIQRLYDYMTSPRLINNPSKRFKLTNELLQPWGFNPLASGTNRRAFYCVYDPGIIFKIASDAVGQKDNQSELFIQQMLRPFCPKVFNVDGDGVIALSERGEPMTEHDYKFVWAEEIFDLLFSLLARGYILEDVGSNFYKNFGIRLGFGPMIWDFPYVYKLDWRKLICQKPDHITGKPCGGEIDYAYNKGMSEIVCTRCGARYSARYLASSVPGEAINFVNKERGIQMGKFDTNFIVSVRRGDKIVATYGKETKNQQTVDNRTNRRTLANGERPQNPEGIVTQAGAIPTMSPQAAQVAASAAQSGMVLNSDMMTGINQMYGNVGTQVTIQTVSKNDVAQNVVAPYGNQQPAQGNYILPNINKVEPYRDTNNPAYRQPAKGQVVAAPHVFTVQPKRQVIQANGQKGITITPEEFLALIAHCQATGKEVPIQLIQAAPELAATMLQNKAEPKHVKPIDTVGPVAEFEHYYKNGKRLFYYPAALKNRVIQWLIHMQNQFGAQIAEMLAEKLEVEYDTNKKAAPKPTTPQQPKPNLPPAQKPQGQVSVYPKLSPKPAPTVMPAPTYQANNQMVQQPTTEVVVAPKPPQKTLLVEDPANWKSRPAQFQQATSDTVTLQPQQTAEVQTTNLFPVKPMSVEEKEAEDAKANHDGAITGFPGVAMVDTLRFKSEMPKIKAMVEQRFNNFPLSIEEADQQVVKLANDIKEFIAPDVANIMGTDQNGVEVFVTRTTDHRNADCFKVDAYNYKSALFMTVLYPSNEKVDQAIKQDMESEVTMKISQEELVAFFEKCIAEFNPEGYETEKELKEALIGFIFSNLSDTYTKDQITTPRGFKVRIESPTQQPQQPAQQAQPQQQARQVAPVQVSAGSVGAAL